MDNINVGIQYNDGLGDKLRDAFLIVNENFTELENLVGGSIVSDLQDSITNINSLINGLTPINHNHLVSEINGLQTLLNGLVSSTIFNNQISSINATITTINSNLNILINSLDGFITSTELDEKVDKFLTIEDTILVSGWTGSAPYEYTYSNVNITDTSIVDVVPDNSAYTTIVEAQLLPKIDTYSGSLKIYSNNIPSDDIDVTLIINKN